MKQTFFFLFLSACVGCGGQFEKTSDFSRDAIRFDSGLKVTVSKKMTEVSIQENRGLFYSKKITFDVGGKAKKSKIHLCKQSPNQTWGFINGYGYFLRVSNRNQSIFYAGDYLNELLDKGVFIIPEKLKNLNLSEL